MSTCCRSAALCTRTCSRPAWRCVCRHTGSQTDIVIYMSHKMRVTPAQIYRNTYYCSSLLTLISARILLLAGEGTESTHRTTLLCVQNTARRERKRVSNKKKNLTLRTHSSLIKLYSADGWSVSVGSVLLSGFTKRQMGAHVAAKQCKIRHFNFSRLGSFTRLHFRYSFAIYTRSVLFICLL